MLDALSATETSMFNDVERMRAISHNLANVTTPGFKREILISQTFSDHLNFSSPRPSSTVSFKTIHPRPASFTDHRVGSLRQTANPLDLALEDRGYFTIMGQLGPLYTRQGNFHLDAQGRLVTISGLPVLDQQGGEIRLTTPQPVIDSDGKIFEGERIVAQLQIVQFASSENLVNLGQGLYRAGEGQAPEQKNLTRVRQGYLETSNVTMADEMIRMVETVRHFESSQRVLKSYDSMLEKSINVIGEF